LLDQHDTHTRSVSSVDMIFVGVGLSGVKLSQFPSKMICRPVSIYQDESIRYEGH
jgi:hypothetical protein